MAQARRGVLIDTSILIAHVRGRLFLRDLLQDYDDAYISAFTLYEFEFGANRARRTSDFAGIEAAFRPNVLTVGRAEADLAAQMNGALASRNRQIGPGDAIIAGTALNHGLELMTLNIAEFRRIPDLVVIAPTP